MKAPAKVHKFLTSIGFCYCDGSYSTFLNDAPLLKDIRFDRHDRGVLMGMGLFYPVGDSGAGINPHETTELRADGKLWFGPFPMDETQDLQQLYFPPKDVDRLYEAVERDALDWLDKLADGELMLALLDALMGRCDLPGPFQYLARFKYLRRNQEGGPLSNKLGYLNYLGRYDDALALLAHPALEKKWESKYEKKIESDARARKIYIDPAFLEKMRASGAKLPASCEAGGM